jgi:hypothetical protein
MVARVLAGRARARGRPFDGVLADDGDLGARPLA